MIAEDKQFCTFTLDSLLFGVEVRDVQEVIRYQHITYVPRAAQSVHGLINLRGQIVTAIDLRSRLKLNKRPADRQPMNVVIRSGDDVVSMLVDEIGDVVSVDETTFEKPPDTLDGVARSLIRGAYKLENRLLLNLDTEKNIKLYDQDLSSAWQ